ncbi:MAG TPA: NAD(P)/FAD-dependent oxidoreductase [bacterium]|nr:NAD(P)/FAD-dependent oxidoreductase [bacterium]
MEHQPVDIAVVGAGAAGLMTAIWAARTARKGNRPLEVLLIDSRPKIGAKILMSGGTRCNVTHKEVKPSDFQGGPSHFVKHVLEAFTPRETIRFFEEIGVALVLEPTGKYFPVTHSAQTVLDALIREAERAGVTLKKGVRITEIRQKGSLFHLQSDQGMDRVTARKMVLTTGGLSYPTTGSDGTGYALVKSFGHTVVATFPALTPLLTNDSDWKTLSGLSLEAGLSFSRKGKKECECRGAFLFTHFGFSGPAALDISGHYAAAKKEDNPRITASFLPHHHGESLTALFQNAQKKKPAKLLKNFLTEKFFLPERFVVVLLRKAGIRAEETAGGCSKENRLRLIRALLDYPLEVSGVFGYKKAEVTAGGVDLKEVKVQTMESKLAEGLYLAGEILDVDGRIGGFNFQWAWSTGALAGRGAAKSLIA